MDSSTVLQATSILGLSSSFWLSGIYFGSSQLTLPILYRFPAAISADIFTEFYYRGIPVVVPLSVIAGLSYGTAAYVSENKRVAYSVAALLALLAMPWTILVMKKTIDTLIEVASDEKVREKIGEKGTVALLKEWKWMNMVRSMMPLAAGAAGVFAFAS